MVIYPDMWADEMADDTIKDLRTQIDGIDEEILDLLGKRMALSSKIGHVKYTGGRHVIDLEREEEILSRLLARNRDCIPENTLRAIYREIFSASRAIQAPETVAYLGPEGTFTHEASLERFGQAASYTECWTVSEIFDLVERGEATFGVVPIENSIEGSVRETLDRLMVAKTRVCGEISLLIKHALLNLTGRIEDVNRVVSHPQALGQCRMWLASRLPGIALEETSSTAKAALAAAEDSTVAAIANERAAVRFGLRIARRAIQDREENVTRFLVLGNLTPRPTGSDRTSLVFWTEDRPGALYRILEKFARFNLNLSRILSRPDRNASPWKYAFFVDVEGHWENPEVARCIEELASRETIVKVLGSYPIHCVHRSVREEPEQNQL